MSTLPSSDIDQIVYCEQHWPVWNLNPALIGLSPTAVTAIKVATGNARAAYDAGQAARQASKAATVGVANNVVALHTLAAEAIKTIRLFAQSTNNPSVYQTAQIDPPAPATPALPPTQPVQLRASIEPTGALTLAWKVAPSSTINGQSYDASTVGVQYIIARKINSEASFTQVGAAEPSRAGARGTSTFTDTTLAAGSTNIQYLITPRRVGLVGPASEVLSVTLGIGGPGLSIASQFSSPMSAKMAA